MFFAVNNLLEMDDVLKSGSSFYRDRLSFNKEESVDEIDYREEGRIPVARDVETGEVISLPFHKRTRILLCAKSGEGKTLLGKSYLSRIVDMDGSVFCGSDIKNDFQSFDYKNGVSKRIIDETQGLLDSEEDKVESRDFKTDFAKTLAIPYFLKDNYEGNPRTIGSLFTIGFSDISKDQFKDLIELSSWRSDSQTEIMRDILSTVDMDEVTWEYLFRRIDEDAGNSSDKLKRKIRHLKNNNVLGNKAGNLPGVIDFESVNLVSLGLKGIDYNSDSSIEFYSGLAHKKFIESCKKGDVPEPRVIYDDEVHEICPSNRETQVKDELALAFSRKGRQAGLVTVLSSQEPHKIPSENDRSPHDFVKDTSHAFVGRGLNWKGYRTVFQVFRVYDSNNTEPLRSLTNSLDRHQFLYLDQDMESVEDVRVVESLAPLVSHPET